ncbi:MAG TPA: hypothetical protein VET27_11555 [Mycobacterium sp.]|nr:hypothetical protein [Mycobacterium sp.]
MNRGDLAVFLPDVLDRDLHTRAAPFAATFTAPLAADRRVR